MTSPADDLGSELLAEYEMLGELGRGGSAIVYRARDRELGRDVAIKVVRPRFSVDDDDALQRLAREARTVAGLQHANIVTVHAVRRLNDGGLALVMQLVPGRTLKAVILDGGPLAPQTAERVLRDVAAALAYAHAHGVVHRDVKPENIFIDEQSGRALLSDFGIAHNTEFDSRLTMTGTAIGTPAYMSPEQIDGKPTDARSDVFSLGLVGWEMLTGERPWEGETLYNVIYKQKHDELPAIDSLRSGVPRKLQYMIERMLQKRPAARWAGADGLLAFMNASVLPSDWAEWQEAHRRRRAREKTASDALTPAAGLFSAALATVRFRRSDPLDASASRGNVAVTSSAAVASDVADDDADATPSWMRDAPARRGPGRMTLVALALVVGAGAFTTVAYRRTTTPVVPARLADVAVVPVQVPVQVPVPVRAPMQVVTADTAASVSSDSNSSASAGTLGSGALPSPASNTARAPKNPITATASESLLAALRDSLSRSAAQQRALGVGNRRAGNARVVPAPAGASGSAAGELSPSVRATDDRGIIAAGGRHTCAIDNGHVFCWGANDRGQLGDGEQEAHTVPAGVVGDLTFVSVSAGIAHSCGVTTSGEAYCWGSDDAGQLGDATTTSRSAPVRVGSNLAFRSVRTGLSHTCGLTTSGSVACWGANNSGQLGDNSTSSHSSPAVTDARVRFIAVATGWNHSCGLSTDGVAFCWGDNSAGQLGDGSRTRRLAPQPVASPVRFTSIAAGSAHTCAVSESGEAYCWGRNNYGQLGTGDAADHPAPTAVQTAARFVSVVAGSVHSCARTTGGAALCWGRNLYGQLGDGSNTDRSTPVRVIGATSFVALSATGAHSCGTSTAGETSCWGFNNDGQLGDGSRNHRSRPLRVAIPDR